ncbi:ABC transporter ATP-binding protein [Vibrio ziniensis]|uniref:ABC transporter ATP-binding protein n=1 Tax=Vibrio ziniensis TaxID=2711221 RepID=A0A6G7CKX6_9VIBR|nr:ABC transporter ATP-binding protein [Vibrio ziniensis]QIH42752.1 ABC transporter ATP-binding protein [Vibrio ziniensis]
MNNKQKFDLAAPNLQEDGSRLSGSNLSLSYESTKIFSSLDVSIPDNKFTVIIGPNGCGKSTLLRMLCRLLKPNTGGITLDGEDIYLLHPKTLAKQIGLLPQRVHAPDGIRVKDLISRGRYPYQKLFQQWSPEDEQAVCEAMQLTDTEHLSERLIEELSGGQRQRVWIAMVLAQQTPILFLDEPTTYLDIAHQIDLLELCRDLNRRKNFTIVAVLHELNQAFRYADHIILMSEGEIAAQGGPKDIVSSEIIKQVFNLDCLIMDDPISHTPMVIPYGK